MDASAILVIAIGLTVALAFRIHRRKERAKHEYS